jgi:hypothetical protein
MTGNLDLSGEKDLFVYRLCPDGSALLLGGVQGTCRVHGTLLTVSMHVNRPCQVICMLLSGHRMKPHLCTLVQAQLTNILS